MSISAQETPNEGVKYLINRLISDLVGTLDACNSIADMAMDNTYDCLGSVYPLIGSKAGTKELIGSTVSIGGGYLLAAKHSLRGYRKPFTSHGTKTFPRVGIEFEEVTAVNQAEILELQLVNDEISHSADLALLRVTCIQDCQKLKSARLPAFEPTSIASGILSLINNYGVGALFVGFGAMSQTGIAQKLQKNDITTFICNQDLAEQTISQIYTAPANKLANDNVVKTNHLFLTLGSSMRHPYSNDSGGGLFIFFEGKAYLVGLHFKAIKFGNSNPVTYPLFVNLLSIGPRVSKLIQKDRVSFLKGGNVDP